MLCPGLLQGRWLVREERVWGARHEQGVPAPPGAAVVVNLALTFLGSPSPGALRREEWRGRAEKECGRLTWP